MWAINRLYDLLSSLGLQQQNPKLLFLGLDNSGKTTLLQMLKTDQVATTYPTLYGSTVEFTIGRMHFTAYDIGGHQQARPIWKEYFSEVDGIVFLVDATDSERFSEVKDKLDFLLSAEELAKMPFVVLGSKIDKPDAVSEEELVKQLGLFQTTGKGKVEFDGVRPLEVFMCSVMTRQGYDEGLRWLGGNL